jgi:hypothetical protein
LLPPTLIVASSVIAVGCTRLASDDPIPALEILVVGLALICAPFPDNHLGLLVVVLIGFNWVLAVDDPTTPWSIGAGISLAVLHTSLAATGVAPLAAPWTRAMYRRWGRRLLTVAAATIPAWALAAALSRTDIPGSPALLVAALLALAVGAVWARHGDLRVDPPG